MNELAIEGWLGLENDMHAFEDTLDIECVTVRESGHEEQEAYVRCR